MATTIEQLLEKKPKWMKEEVLRLRKEEGKIQEALKKRELKELFLKDPGEFFAKIHLPLSRKSLYMLRKNQKEIQEFIRPYHVKVEGLQTLKVKVRINIK